MLFARALFFVFLWYAVNSGENRTLKNDFNLEKKIALAPLAGTKHEVNQVPSNYVKRGNIFSFAFSYSSKVDKFFKELFPSDPGSCLNKAKQKSATFTKYSKRKQKAVQLVNIYTQECKKYMGIVGKPIYSTLNENLRGKPKKIWKRMSALLNKGLALLGRKKIPNLYRGCHCPIVKKGTPFTFKQFASTSSNPAVALKFLSAGKSFIHIKEAEGTDIKLYSYYSNEDEFLLGPDVNLDVVQVETVPKRIHEEIKKISPSTKIQDLQGVKMFVVLDGSRKKKKAKGGFWSTCLCGGGKL
ncbi:NAD(P)(+)--arginine ADP-ribosyltransferase 2-like [Paramuricea clavata]|uniref:NAD(P)(+)--arginine ADP-ribosyltransferase n=1 Tax=Paramuricea clavata TaxID=317549 RepID=A0A7D9LVN7_PARCT|nr:NAD(P)(+)--arginine ADP-ribosyltransferase 2-like [Paramuricea clavata]